MAPCRGTTSSSVTDDHLIVGVHVSRRQRRPLLRTHTGPVTEHAELLGQHIGLVLADAGYFTEENLTSPGPDRLIAPEEPRCRRDAQATPPPGHRHLTSTLRHHAPPAPGDPKNAEKAPAPWLSGRTRQRPGDCTGYGFARRGPPQRPAKRPGRRRRTSTGSTAQHRQPPAAQPAHPTTAPPRPPHR